MPVRDALALLEQEGLVERAARRWTRVVELSPALVEELVPLVSLLEQYGVSSAAAVALPAIAELRGANAELREAIEAGDVRSASEADSRFHEGLVELAENRSLERALSEARTRLRLLRPQVMKRDGAFDSVADHDQIVECLEEGNRKAAARALAKNWRRGLARFRASQATRPDD